MGNYASVTEVTTRIGTTRLAQLTSDTGASVTESKVEEAIASGESVLIFPEATFTAATGLRPFRLGAFQIALATGRPVVPVALEGTRRVLRDKTWIPRRGPIHVRIGEPLIPEG